MPGLRGLTVVVAGDDAARLRSALALAAAQAALGAPARLFLDDEAVALLRPPIEDPGSARRSTAGLPQLADLVREAPAIGVRILACQSGLALAGMEAGDLPPGVETSGLVELLRTIGEDRLVFA